MKSTLKSTAAGAALVLAAIHQVYAQYTPPPPPAPFPGFINEWLRKDDPYMNKWDIGGSWRLRLEIKEGFGIAGKPGSVDFRDDGTDVDNEYLLSRLRLRVGYTDKWWSALVEGRSSYALNDERWAFRATPAIPGTKNNKGNGPESDTIDLHQAFFTLGNHKEFPLSLKVGRQELSYGEERLVGAFAWNNIGRVFDAAKLRWQNPWFGVDVFAGRVVIPEDGRFNVNNDYDFFSGAYASSTTLVPKNILDFYFLARNASTNALVAQPSPQFPQPTARDIYTAGARLKSKPGELGDWDYSLEAAYQFGHFRDNRIPGGVNSAMLDHQAYMVVVQGGYTFTECWATPRLGFEYAHGSGDDNPTDGRHETFENLFPTNHKFYGYMDISSSLQNIHNVRGIVQLKPHKQVSVALEAHAFWLAETTDNFYNKGGAPRGGIGTTPGNNYGINPAYGSYVGSEIDLIAGWAVTRQFALEGGYGHFFRGEYIKQSLSAIGSQDADYVYLQANLNF